MWTKETLEKAAAEYAALTCTFKKPQASWDELNRAFLEGCAYIINNTQKEGGL